MVVLNDLDRFHLALDVLHRVPHLREEAAHFADALRDKLTDHKQYIAIHGEDMAEVRDWTWPHGGGAS